MSVKCAVRKCPPNLKAMLKNVVHDQRGVMLFDVFERTAHDIPGTSKMSRVC